MKRVLGNPWAAVVFLAPAFLLYFVFSLSAIFESLALSFFRFNLGTLSWVGIANYRRMVGDSLFLSSTLHIFQLLLIVAGISIPTAFFVAWLLSAKGVGSGLARSVMYIPNLLSTVATGTMWVYLFDNQFGVVNRLLRFMGSDIHQSFLSNPHTVLPVIGFVMAWHAVGFYSILFIVAIQNIPSDIVDSCRIDGFTEWQRVRYVTLPLIFPTIQIVLVLAVTGAFKSFDYVYVLSGGGPNRASEVLSTYMYQVGFQHGNLGYAASIGLVLFALSTVISRSVYRLGKSDVAQY
jgi:raffinose/stachyose/melibiose transport system permease protein